MKILFTQYFTVIFQKDASSGSYILNPTTLGNYSDVDMNDVEAIIYHFSDNAYVRQALERDVVNGIKAYQGNISDEGYQLSLNNGDTVTFSFKVFEPQSIANPPDNGTQTFFAYKLDVVQAPATQAYAVTVADSENGAVESSHTSAEENTTVTLTVKPAQGYALEELIVDSRNVTGEVADNAYSFPMPGHAVTVTAKFKHVCGGAETVPGAPAGCEDGWKEYHKCACGKLYEEAACQNEITDLEDWKSGGGKIEAVHAPGDYKYDDEKHWKECACGLSKQDEDKHDFENELDEKCDTCGYVREIGQETFEVTVQTQGNGEADVDVDKAPENGEVRLTIKPADGHRLVRLTVNDQDVTSVVNPGNDEYLYLCRVTDAHGSTMLSGAAVLHVCALPALPQTGDSSAPMLWLAMGVLSVLGMAILRKKAHAR